MEAIVSKPDGFTVVVAIDESIFVYDALVKSVWIHEEDERPVVKVTGSHQHTCVFGALSMMDGNNNNNKQQQQMMFRQYSDFNAADTTCIPQRIAQKVSKDDIIHG